MSLTNGEAVYTGERKWLRIPDVYIDDGTTKVLLTDLTLPSGWTLTYTVEQGGVEDSTGSLTHHTSTDGLWQAQVVMPATRGQTVVKAEILDGADSYEFYRDTFILHSR